MSFPFFLAHSFDFGEMVGDSGVGRGELNGLTKVLKILRSGGCFG